MQYRHQAQNNNRLNLLNIIRDSPGIRYVELKKITKLSYGTLTYHLTKLERDGKIKVLRKRRKTMYSSIQNVRSLVIIECVRCKICNKILNILLIQSCRESMLVNMLSIPRSTLRYHLKRLRDRSLINNIKVYRSVFYYINNDKIGLIKDTLFNQSI